MQSPPFNVTIPENNVFGVSPGPSQAVSDGIWIILKPLPVGEHKIGFKGSSVDFTTGLLQVPRIRLYQMQTTM